MTLLGPDAVKAVFNAVEAEKRNQRLAERQRQHEKWIERQKKIAAMDAEAERTMEWSAWNANRLRRYRSMGYSVRRLCDLSGHPIQLVVTVAMSMRGKRGKYGRKK